MQTIKSLARLCIEAREHEERKAASNALRDREYWLQKIHDEFPDNINHVEKDMQISTCDAPGLYRHNREAEFAKNAYNALTVRAYTNANNQ